jgi:hypothetical protein
MIKRAFLDVNRACSGLLLRQGLDPLQPGDIVGRFPSGKRRDGPKVVRIKRGELSKNRK